MPATFRFFGWANDDLQPGERQAVKERALRTAGHMTVHGWDKGGPFWCRVTSERGTSLKLPTYASAYRAGMAGLTMLEEWAVMAEKGRA